VVLFVDVKMAALLIGMVSNLIALWLGRGLALNKYLCDRRYPADRPYYDNRYAADRPNNASRPLEQSTSNIRE